MASKWDPLKTVSRRVREVILRTIGMLIKSQSLIEIGEILLLIFVVITNETDGFNQNTSLETPCEQFKNKLIDYSSTGK